MLEIDDQAATRGPFVVQLRHSPLVDWSVLDESIKVPREILQD